jgi:hypothetical protein
VSFPADPRLEEELLAIQYQLAHHEGKVQVVSKETIRKALGRSPDRADSLIMALWHSVERKGSRRYATLGHYYL